jgi:rare lipoprotein A (peptidoglycan hydrolase)
LLLAACSSQENPKFSKVKIGKPYEINGKTYYPAADSTYDKIGDASWYGPGFHGKRTASGEIFDQEDITAAHPTLPIPSLVLVTNLKNNKSIVCRINDRGPFHSNRIIDLSKRTAELVGLKSTEPVRVRFLKKETEDYIASIKGKSPRIDMVAFNENYNNRPAEPIPEPTEQIAQAEIQEPTQQTYIDDNTPDYNPQTIESSDLVPNAQPIESRNLLISEARADDNMQNPKPLLDNNSYAPAPKQEQNYLRVPPPKQLASNNLNSANKSDLPSSSSGNYRIIAGSFSMNGNAHNLAGALTGVKNHKKMVTVEKVERGEKTWWRVVVGPYASRDDAQQALESVRDAGVQDAHISRL